MLIYDPTTYATRPAISFAVLGAVGSVAILEGATGKPFRYDRVTGASESAICGDVELFELEDAEPEVIALSTLSLSGPIEEATSDEPTKLKAIFLAGAGGSGKGKVGATMFGGTGLKIIDQDRHLERFMAAAKMPLKDVGLRYDLLKKAQRMKSAETRQYGSRRLGLVIDSTAWDYERIAGPVRKLRSLGYDCYMVFVDAALETAVARNDARAAAGGRDVPYSFIKDAHAGAQSNLPQYRKLFGGTNLTIIDNNAEVSDEDWILSKAPALRKIAAKILHKPIKNPKGLAWLAAQEDPATAVEPTTDDWPIDVPPPIVKPFVMPHFAPISKVTTPTSGPATNTASGKPKVKGGWNNTTKQFESVSLSPVPEVPSDWTNEQACLVPSEVWRVWVDYYPSLPCDVFLRQQYPALAAKVFKP